MAGSLLSIADQALNAAETALTVTANDTANSDNPAFVNQTAAVTSGPVVGPISDTLPNSAPSGVTVAGVTSATDPVLNHVIQQQTSQVGYWNQLAAQQSAIQPLFNEPQTGGLQEMLTAFGNAWTTLADNPGSSAEAASVLSSGQALATTIQSLQANLAQQASTITTQLQSQMHNLAAFSQTLAQTNTTLAGLPPESSGASQLQDTLAATVQGLASVASVQTLTASDGTTNVTSGGVALVTGTTTPPAASYQVALHGTGPWYTQSVGLSIAGAPYTPTGGAIAGNLAALQQIQAAGQQLATLSHQLAGAVPTGQSTAPTHFFTATANGALTVTANVTTSTLQASGASAALTAIQTAEGAWTQVVGGVGNAGQQAMTEQANQQADLSALQTQQQSIQGVNLNQAAANTVQEQEAYQAATQLVQVQQSLVNSLLAAVS